jgi:hypothetical protein
VTPVEFRGIAKRTVLLYIHRPLAGDSAARRGQNGSTAKRLVSSEAQTWHVARFSSRQAENPRVCPTRRNVTTKSLAAIVQRLFSLPVRTSNVCGLPKPLTFHPPYSESVYASGCPSDGRRTMMTRHGFQPVQFPMVNYRGGSKRASASPLRASGLRRVPSMVSAHILLQTGNL